MSHSSFVQIINNHVNWFNAITSSLAFPDDCQHMPGLITLDTLYEHENQSSSAIYQESDRLRLLSMSFIKAGEKIINRFQDQTITRHDYSDFSNLLSEICYHIERFSETSAQTVNASFENNNFIHGVKRQKDFMVEYDAEIQKIKRHSYESALVLIKMTGMIQNDETRDKAVYSVIKNVLRPYDSAYLFDNNFFMMCLKYTNTQGALAVFERFVDEAAEHESNDVNTIVFKACLYQGQEFDVPETVLDNLKEQLDQIRAEQTVITNHEESSTLEKYLLNSQEDI